MPQLTLRIGPRGPVVRVLVAPSHDRLQALEVASRSPPRQSLFALLDTGASHTCLDSSVLEALALTPTGTIEVKTPLKGSGLSKRGQCDVALLISSSVPGESPLVFDTLEVVVTELQGAFGVHALLGRDVLERCLLIYHGPESQFTLAY